MWQKIILRSDAKQIKIKVNIALYWLLNEVFYVFIKKVNPFMYRKSFKYINGFENNMAA